MFYWELPQKKQENNSSVCVYMLYCFEEAEIKCLMPVPV